MVSLSQRRPFICLSLTGAFLLSQLAACSSWRVQGTTPREFRVRDAAQQVRIVRVNGTQVTLTGAHVSGDTLYGTSVPTVATIPAILVATIPAILLAIPLSDIRAIAVRQADGEKTIYLVIGIAALTTATLAGLFHLILATDPS